MIFISSEKLFSFLIYWIFCLFFPFLSTVSRFKRSDHKRNLFTHVLQLKEKLVTSSTLFLLFMILWINGDWVQRKNQVNFFMVSFDISSLWSLLKFQSLLLALTVLGYLTKLKRVIGLVLNTYFQHSFSMKMGLIKWPNDPNKWPSFTIWGVWPEGLSITNRITMFLVQTPLDTQLLFGSPTANTNHYQRHILTNLMLITTFSTNLTRRLPVGF